MKNKKTNHLTIIEYILVICLTISVFMCVVTDIRQYQRWVVSEMDVRTLFILKQLKTIEMNQQRQMDEASHSQQVFLQD